MATKTKRNRKSTPTTARAAAKSKATRDRRTKAGTIVDLLQRPSGASIARLTKATGWQAHSVRAAISGLRKTGLGIHRDKNSKGITVYRATQV